MDLDRACNLVWYWVIRGRDLNEVEKFKLQLWQPPPNAPAPTQGPWSAEEETNAFRSLKSALNK